MIYDNFILSVASCILYRQDKLVAEITDNAEKDKYIVKMAYGGEAIYKSQNRYLPR